MGVVRSREAVVGLAARGRARHGWCGRCRCAGSSSAARASAPRRSVASRTRRRPSPRTMTAVSRCAWTPSRAAASATPAAISTLLCTCRRTLRRRRAARYATRLHALASLALASLLPLVLARRDAASVRRACSV